MSERRETVRETNLPTGLVPAWRGLALVPGSALLESGPGYGELGRYGIYACFPRAVFEVRGSRWRLSGDAPLATPAETLAPAEALRALVKATRGDEGEGIFRGGWIGYFGYEFGGQFERLPTRHPERAGMPDVHVGYYDTFLLHDRVLGKLELVTTDRFGEGAEKVRERRRRFEGALGAKLPTDAGRESLIAGGLASDFSPDDYCEAVARVREYLGAGDVFQVNLSQEFFGRLTGSWESAYARALARSPAPFAAYMRGEDWGIISTSPERFLLLTPEREVETRPIKGTRPRGRDPIHDLLLKDELILSAKDAAELNMIVDLERNDLGRVCSFGSVRVARHRQIESFANVHHAVSVVRGTLRPGMDEVDLLRATFPGGSITGAPKIRAMEIIDEIERGRRGVYTGAIGYISDHGRMDLNIAIRTLVMSGKTVSYRVGGGIVIDSDPLAEYRETLAKGRRLREVLLGDEA